MKTYISGPITGVSDWRERFAEAERRLVAAGLAPDDVVSPLRLSDALDAERAASGLPPPTWADYLRNDIRALLDCDAVALLSGWERSEGASLEARVAGALGMRLEPL